MVKKKVSMSKSREEPRTLLLMGQMMSTVKIVMTKMVTAVMMRTGRNKKRMTTEWSSCTPSSIWRQKTTIGPENYSDQSCGALSDGLVASYDGKLLRIRQTGIWLSEIGRCARPMDSEMIGGRSLYMQWRLVPACVT